MMRTYPLRLKPGQDLKGSLDEVCAREGSHLHILVSDEEGLAKGGHLKEGAIVRTTAEIVIGILPDWEFRREVDAETGFLELEAGKSSC